MSQRMKLFIFLLIINLIVVVFYLIWNYIRRKEKIGISTVLMRKWREIWSLWKKPWKLQIRRAFVL